MAKYKNRRIFIIPAVKRSAANSQLESLGYGPDNFSVAMSPSGNPNGKETHFLCDVSMTDAMLSDFRGVIGATGKEKDVGPLGTRNRFENAISGEGITRKKS